MNQKIFNMVLKILIAFAIGALLGDAFLHLIPDSAEENDEHEEEEHEEHDEHDKNEEGKHKHSNK